MTGGRDQDIRVCFIGDSLVNGTGDTAALGWTGRVCAAANRESFRVTHYNLGVRRDTSADVAARWGDEVARRQGGDADHRIAFSWGVNDTSLEHGRPRVSLEDCLANTRAILSAASAAGPVLMVGPTPVTDDSQNERIAALSGAFEELLRSLSIPYLPVVEALLASGPWMHELAAGDGSHPGPAGYAHLADLIMAWPSWWFAQRSGQGASL